MRQYFLKYLITCTSGIAPEEMITKYDPLLLEEVNLILTSMIGESCCLVVEQVELVGIDE